MSEKKPEIRDKAVRRKKHIDKLYDFLKELENIEPKRTLNNCTGRMKWPKQGVYFFFEIGELRENKKPRVVRIGTHAVSEGSKKKLWGRLRDHKGKKDLTGNHRGSVFRKLIGFALIKKNEYEYPFWGKKEGISKEIKENETKLEIEVSKIIGKIPFLCLEVLGEASKNNMRAYIETNAIALLSNKNKDIKIDLPSKQWLGYFSGNKKVIDSGLWNSDDTEKEYNLSLLRHLTN